MKRKVLTVCFISLCFLVSLLPISLRAAGRPDVTRHEVTFLESAVNVHIEWQSPNPVVIVKISVAGVEKEIKVDEYDNKRNRDGYAGEVTVTMGLEKIPTQNFTYVVQLEDDLRIKSPLVTGKVKVATAKQPRPPATQIQIQQTIPPSGTKPVKKTGVKPGAQPPAHSGGEQVGSIIVIIEPQTIVESGAMWRVGNKPWKKSGETIPDLPVGTHIVEFQSVRGWTKPKSENVTIEGGQTLTFNGTYSK